MSWRPSAPRPNPLHALRRIAERPDSDARGEPVRVAAGTGVIVPPRPRPPRARTPMVSRRPASEAEPSHRSPERSPQALITTTPTPEAAEAAPAPGGAADLPGLGPLSPLPVPPRPTLRATRRETGAAASSARPPAGPRAQPAAAPARRDAARPAAPSPVVGREAAGLAADDAASHTRVTAPPSTEGPARPAPLARLGPVVAAPVTPTGRIGAPWPGTGPGSTSLVPLSEFVSVAPPPSLRAEPAGPKAPAGAARPVGFTNLAPRAAVRAPDRSRPAPSPSGTSPAAGLARVAPTPRIPKTPRTPKTQTTPRSHGDAETADGRRHLSAPQVLIALLACLGLWTLLDAPALARSAETSQFGTRRTIALDVLRPISRLSAALGLDRIDRVSQELLGHKINRTQLAPPPTLPVKPPLTRQPAGGAPKTPALPPALPPLRVPTEANPLRVLVIGDSLGLTFGQSLAAKLDATGLAKTTVDAREGTGMTRPDAFDWPSQLRADIVRFHPEVIVASFGGNDDQDVQVNGRFIPFASSAWDAIYRGRIAQVVSETHTANARLLWDGLPVMRSASKTARLAVVMNATRVTLAGSDGALFVDNLGTLADAAGHYQVALPNASGSAVLVRQPDGIHETPAGADRLADKAIATMRTRWHLAL